jgi:hypothetical protein
MVDIPLPAEIPTLPLLPEVHPKKVPALPQYKPYPVSLFVDTQAEKSPVPVANIPPSPLPVAVQPKKVELPPA